jgi:hypothetical protein
MWAARAMLTAAPMKLDPKAAVGSIVTSSSPTQPFKKLLNEATAELKGPTPTVRAPVQVIPRAAVKSAVVAATTTSAQTLTRARTAAHVEAERLTHVRAETQQHAQAATQSRADQQETLREKTVDRILEIIAREFSPEGTPPGAPALQPQPAVTPPVHAEVSNETQAAQAVALIERIEVFVKSQRPGLALTLNNSLGAHVEIERIGPKEIALKIVGHRGPPSAEAVGRIRDELRARGLKVGALSVA